MKKLFGKLNKQGSALVTVIVCMLFVGIIASIVLTIASSNLNGGKMGRQSKDNFYSTENVMDEIKTRLQEYSNEAIAEAYKQWLQRYALVSGDDHLTEFNRIFVEEMKERLAPYFYIVNVAENGTRTPLPSSPTGDITDLLYNYDTADVVFADRPTIAIDANGNMTIENVSVAFTDAIGFSSNITTDLNFKISLPTIKANQVSGMNMNIPMFAIIADGTVKNFVQSGDEGIVSSPDIAAGNASIYGSIYGGGKRMSTGKYDTKGIWFQGGNTKLYSDYIISRTSFASEGGATTTIKGRRGEYDGILENGAKKYFYSNIWAKNIEFQGTSSSRMTLQGSCYLADDLTMDAKRSSFTLQGENSEFYGYSTDYSPEPSAETSSAIVINGENVTVDLSAAKNIWLAGKSFIYVPKYWGKATDNTDKAFRQGESITYRALQSAYMVPGECIVGVGHNPLSEDEFTKVSNDNMKDGYYVDVTQSFVNGGINLGSYVDLANPYKYASVSYGGENLIYVYLNFSSPDTAADYFADYYSRYSDLVEDKMQQFGEDGKIIINPDALFNTGNVLAYDEKELTFIPKSASILDIEHNVIEVQDEIASRYGRLTTGLSEDFGFINNNIDITKNLVNMDDIKIDAYSPLGTKLEVNGMQIDSYLITATEDVHIAQDGIRFGSDAKQSAAIQGGIILAKGNVYIETGVTFYGTIIAGGSVFFGGDTRIETVPTSIQKLILTNPTVIPYFSLGDDYGTKDGGMTDTSDLVDITYSNWKKN